MGEFESSKKPKKVEHRKDTTTQKRAATFCEVKPTKVIRYRTSFGQVIALAFFITLSLGMGAYILSDTLVKKAESQKAEPEKVVMSSTKGAVINSEYGHLYLLKSGVLYYTPNGGMSFEASMQPGVSGRYIIQEHEIEGFKMPASVVGGKAMVTGYVFDGYKVDVENVETIEELDTDTIVGSRSFRIKTVDAAEYLLIVTLGDVQRKIIYDEKDVEVEVEVPVEKEEEVQPAIAQDSDTAEQLGNQALAEAEAEAEAEFEAATKTEVRIVRKRVPKIQLSYGPAKAQLIKL